MSGCANEAGREIEANNEPCDSVNQPDENEIENNEHRGKKQMNREQAGNQEEEEQEEPSTSKLFNVFKSGSLSGMESEIRKCQHDINMAIISLDKLRSVSYIILYKFKKATNK